MKWYHNTRNKFNVFFGIKSGSFILWNYMDEGNFLQPIMQEIKDTPVQMTFMTELPDWECYIGCLSGINLNQNKSFHNFTLKICRYCLLYHTREKYPQPSAAHYSSYQRNCHFPRLSLCLNKWWPSFCLPKKQR